ncbi:MAG: hypothetical protein F4X02_16235 [Chloroflexi bacterium]|nr:hypothetical protein [Chloroflexota bacterium]
MAWTAPKTWSSEPLTSLDLNQNVRDNLNHLKNRLDSSVDKFVSGEAMLQTTATEFVDVDAVNLSLTLTTHGGDVLLGFTGTVQSTVGGRSIYFNVAVDDVDYIADDGIICSQIGGSFDNNLHKPLSFVMLIPGLSAGSHTFKLRWKTDAGNTAKMDVVRLHPQFWAKEI